MTVGTIPHRKVMRSIELYGSQTAPAVPQHLASRGTSQPSTA